eukprot:tig00001490_g8965.t1
MRGGDGVRAVLRVSEVPGAPDHVKLELDVKEAPRKPAPPPRPTHFLSLRLTSPAVISEIERVQKAMLEAAPPISTHLINPTSMHFTLFVMTLSPAELAVAKALLEESDEVRRAAEAFAAAARATALRMKGIGSFGGGRVVWCGLEASAARAALEAFAAAVHGCFAGAGLAPARLDFVPHCTLAKVRFEKLKKARWLARKGRKRGRRPKEGPAPAEELELAGEEGGDAGGEEAEDCGAEEEAGAVAVAVPLPSSSAQAPQQNASPAAPAPVRPCALLRGVARCVTALQKRALRTLAEAGAAVAAAAAPAAAGPRRQQRRRQQRRRRQRRRRQLQQRRRQQRAGAGSGRPAMAALREYRREASLGGAGEESNGAAPPATKKQKRSGGAGGAGRGRAGKPEPEAGAVCSRIPGACWAAFAEHDFGEVRFEALELSAMQGKDPAGYYLACARLSFPADEEAQAREALAAEVVRGIVARCCAAVDVEVDPAPAPR